MTPLKRVAGASASLAVVDGLGGAALVGEPGNGASISSAAVAKLSDLGRDSIAISMCVHLCLVQASHALAGTTKHENRSSGRSGDRPAIGSGDPMGSNPEQELAVSAFVSSSACFLIYLFPCVLVYILLLT